MSLGIIVSIGVKSEILFVWYVSFQILRYSFTYDETPRQTTQRTRETIQRGIQTSRAATGSDLVK